MQPQQVHWFWRWTDWLGRIWLWWTAVTVILVGFLIEWWQRLQDYNPISRALILAGFGILILIAIWYFTRVVGSMVIRHRMKGQLRAAPPSPTNVQLGGMASHGPGAQVHNNLFETHLHQPRADQRPSEPTPEPEPREPRS